VNRAVTQMENATQKNAALAEEASAAARSLQEQAKKLTEVVAAFRLERHDGLIEAQPLIASSS
jgi:methyl-accepting chemotaxis protein